MVATADFELVQATIDDLRAAGDRRRADALEAVLDIALTNLNGTGATADDRLATPATIARWLNLSTATVREWIDTGEVRLIRLGRRRLVPWSSVEAYLQRLKARHDADRARQPPLDREVERTRYNAMLSRLPQAELRRYRELRNRQGDGQRLSRAERAELEALGLALTQAAIEDLRRIVEQAHQASD